MGTKKRLQGHGSRIVRKLKVHTLHSQLQYVLENLDATSKEQGKRFYQDITEKRERLNVNPLAPTAKKFQNVKKHL